MTPFHRNNIIISLNQNIVYIQQKMKQENKKSTVSGLFNARMGALSSLAAICLFELCSVIFKTTPLFYRSLMKMEARSSKKHF